MSAKYVSVALRASIELGSQPGASSAKSIRGILGVQCSRGGKLNRISCQADMEVRGGGIRPENRA